MDYFKDSIDVPRETLLNLWYEIAGEPKKGNSLFTRAHFFDTVDDSRYVCLTLDNFKRLDFDHAKARVWRKRRDCNKKMRAFGVDLSDAVEDIGMQGDGTLGVWSLGYDSKSLSKDPSKPLAGYHAAAICWTWNPKAGAIVPYVVQPPNRWDSGSETKSRWNTVEDEVIFWVSVGGI